MLAATEPTLYMCLQVRPREYHAGSGYGVEVLADSLPKVRGLADVDDHLGQQPPLL